MNWLNDLFKRVGKNVREWAKRIVKKEKRQLGEGMVVEDEGHGGNDESHASASVEECVTTIREDGIIAPRKLTKGEESFFENIKMPAYEGINSNISFEKLDEQTIVGIDNCGPNIMGKLNGTPFIVREDRHNPNVTSATIKVENGNVYRCNVNVKASKITRFGESLVFEDGSKEEFSYSSTQATRTIIQQNDNKIIKLYEQAIQTYKGNYELGSIAQYAQPSDELLNEYSEATGLPNIVYTPNKNSWETEDSIFVVKREATCECPIKGFAKKCISYVFSSKEAFLSGEKPDMIHIEGTDGREGASGMFRLQGDSYVDNSTFRRENGEYTYDTVTYEQIMELAGPLAHLTDKMKLAVKGEYEMPDIVKGVGGKIIKREKNKTRPISKVDIPAEL